MDRQVIASATFSNYYVPDSVPTLIKDRVKMKEKRRSHLEGLQKV